MKKLKAFVIFFTFLTLTSAYAQKVYQGTIWGKVIKKSTPKNIGKYDYFLTFKKGNEHHAFPIEADYAFKKRLDKSLGKTVKVNGKIVENRKYHDGQPMTFYSVKVDAMKTMSMSDLRPTGGGAATPGVTHAQVSVSGGIAIDDDVTNATIFAAGAALIYSILKN